MSCGWYYLNSTWKKDNVTFEAPSVDINHCKSTVGNLWVTTQSLSREGFSVGREIVSEIAGKKPKYQWFSSLVVTNTRERLKFIYCALKSLHKLLLAEFTLLFQITQHFQILWGGGGCVWDLLGRGWVPGIFIGSGLKKVADRSCKHFRPVMGVPGVAGTRPSSSIPGSGTQNPLFKI